MRVIHCSRSPSQLASMAVVLIMLASVSSAQTAPSAKALYRAGLSGYIDGNCVRAARYFFAYSILNPPELQSRPDLSMKIQQVIADCDSNAGYYAAGNNVFFDLKKPTAQGLCEVYSKIAIAQNDANQEFQCGLTGPRWNAGYQYHFQWCMTVKPEERATERFARNSALRTCHGN